MWWESTNVSVADGGPFGYGWRVTAGADAHGSSEGTTLVPHAFYFGAFWTFANGTNGQAYTLQLFTDFDASPPPKDAFDLPPSCETAKACTNWPSDATVTNTTQRQQRNHHLLMQ